MMGRQDMVVAYRSLLPRLAVIQQVYQSLLQDLLPAAVSQEPQSQRLSESEVTRGDML